VVTPASNCSSSHWASGTSDSMTLFNLNRLTAAGRGVRGLAGAFVSRRSYGFAWLEPLIPGWRVS
jgi:hypothetical protein